MGRNHVRLLSEMPSVQLVGVIDQDAKTRRQMAAKYGVASFADVRALQKQQIAVDAMVVAVPTDSHFDLVSAALEADCHVLVEKPIAATLEQAHEIARRAASGGKIVMVGHVERYNSAIRELRQRLTDGALGRVFQISARRLGPFPDRVRDVGVVIDLATHDLDIMRFLTGSEAIRLYAETKREIHTSNEDMITAMIRFQNDVLGVLDINWLTPTKTREITVTGERGMFRADYLTQDLFFYENAAVAAAPPGWEALSVLRGVSEGAMTRFALTKREPLRVELDVFIGAVNGSQEAVVSAEDGVRSLELALALVKSGTEHQPIHLLVN